MLSHATTAARSPRSKPLSTFVLPQPRDEISLFEMPTAGPAPIIDAINSAQESVELSIYLMTNPKVIQALKDAAHREVNGHRVNVRVMIEAHPYEAPPRGADYESLARQLKEAGCEVKTTPDYFDGERMYDHAKFLVIDDTTSLIGTGNLVTSSLEPDRFRGNRDFWIADTRDDVALEADRLFEADWNRQSTQGMRFDHLVVTPDDAKSDITGLIDGVGQGEELLVYNQDLYQEDIVDKLIAARERGAHVQVITSSPRAERPGAEPPGPGVDRTGEALQKLAQHGVEVRRMTALLMHAKAIVAGNKIYVGSQNFTYAGVERNRELGEIVEDPRLVAQLTQDFREDWASIP